MHFPCVGITPSIFQKKWKLPGVPFPEVSGHAQSLFKGQQLHDKFPPKFGPNPLLTTPNSWWTFDPTEKKKTPNWSHHSYPSQILRSGCLPGEEHDPWWKTKRCHFTSKPKACKFNSWAFSKGKRHFPRLSPALGLSCRSKLQPA